MKPLKPQTWWQRLNYVRHRDFLDATVVNVAGIQATYVGTWQNLLNFHYSSDYPEGVHRIPILPAIPTRAGIMNEVYYNSFLDRFETIYSYNEEGTPVPEGFVPPELRETKRNRIFQPWNNQPRRPQRPLLRIMTG